MSKTVDRRMITQSNDPGRQKIIDEMLKVDIGIIKHGDFYFIQSGNYKINQELKRYRIRIMHDTLIFPDKIGDMFYNIYDAYKALYFAYSCLQNGDPDADF